ncbi:MAG TPA: TMEM175 family protein [Vicinamibacterales bacterium]
MSKTRLEAFSDGVIAILITIMVLEFKVPHETDLSALEPLAPAFLVYILSFIYLGIYWNNHHHMLHACDHITGAALWPNLHLLFWLSLIPFATAWMGENHFATVPTAVYGVVLLMAGVAWKWLQHEIIKYDGPQSKLRAAVAADFKGNLSLVMYIVGIALAFVHQALAEALYVAVALIWLIPDRRIERNLTPAADDDRPSR